MAQSLARVLIHIVYSTNRRMPSISRQTRPLLHGDLGGILRDLRCPPLAVGGTTDHVHLLFALSRTISIAGAVEEVKTASSRWMKRQDAPSFAWQGGYGAFSVSESQAARVVRYIACQDTRHRRATFQDEFRALLQRHGVSCDERGVWD